MTSSTAPHPRFRRLLDVADGLFDDARVRRAREHVESGCARCAAELASISALRDAVTAGPLDSPPRAAVRRASRLFVAQTLQHGIDAARRVLLTLVFDQRLAAAPSLRSGGGDRRLLWTLGQLELFATVSRDRGGVTVRGQFLPEDPEAAAPAGNIRVMRDGRVAAEARLDDDGEFAAHRLRGGTFVIDGEIEGRLFCSPPFVVEA